MVHLDVAIDVKYLKSKKGKHGCKNLVLHANIISAQKYMALAPEKQFTIVKGNSIL